MLPFSEACERNKEPILRILRTALASSEAVLEVGSGTGQHAVYFARELAHLTWLPSDVESSIPALSGRIRLEGGANLREPLILDVREDPWPVPCVDAVFSANTLHILDWRSVQHFFSGAAGVVRPGGLVCVYGPFRYAGRYTSDSNAAFDRYLRERDPESGIRDAEALDALAAMHGLALQADHAMPANNQLRIWRREGDRTP